MNVTERILAEGRPFELSVSVTGLGATGDFVLDSDTYDADHPTASQPLLANKMLWVSAFVVTPDAAAQIEAVRFDNTLVFAGAAVGEGVDLSGVYSADTSLVMPNVMSRFGTVWLPVRNQITIKHTDATGDAVTSTIKLWGLYTERTM